MTQSNKRPKTASASLIWFGVLIVYLVVLCGATTQWLGNQFGHDQLLGARTLGFYNPFAWFSWVSKFSKDAPVTFVKAELGFGLFAVAGMIAYVFGVGFGLRNLRPNKGIHGTASFATEPEISKMGLLADPKTGSHSGVFVGGYQKKDGSISYLRHDGPEHIAVIAPTRSGKGVGIVVPTLLTWPHSVVINDQKGELWATTASYRKTGLKQTIIKFDPAAETGSARFNPLDEIRIGTVHEVGDTQNVVTIIVDPEGKGLADHWAKTSYQFLTGLVLHLKYDRMRHNMPPPSLADLSRALANSLIPIENLYDAMLSNTHLVGLQHPCADSDHAYAGHIHPVVADAARAQKDRAAAERGSVLSTAQSFLSLYKDPLVAKNISASDFSMSDLMNHDTPVSLYLVVRAEDKERMKPLMRLIINQIVRVLLRPELKFESGRAIPPHLHRLLLMLDEFPSYGRLDVFEEALAYIAGYGIKACLIMQDISQLKKSYGEQESITSNCHIRTAYAPNRIETAKWLSDYCGVTTIISEDVSVSGGRFGMFMQSASRHLRETSRPLLTPDEITKLKSPEKDKDGNIVSPGDMLIFTAGHSPIFGTQSLYFFDQILLDRSKGKTPDKSDKITLTPGQSDARFLTFISTQEPQPLPEVPADDTEITEETVDEDGVVTTVVKTKPSEGGMSETSRSIGKPKDEEEVELVKSGGQ